jgi:hypothetical protein
LLSTKRFWEELAMNERRSWFKKGLLVTGLVALVLVPLLLVSVGSAQEDGPQAEQNLTAPAGGSAAGEVVSQIEDSDLAINDNWAKPDAAPADLIITDPEVDVQEAIESILDIDASSSTVVPAAAFTTDSNSRTWFFGFNSAYLYPNDTGQFCGIAPVYLPNGAKITAMTGYLYDNDGAASASLWLYPKRYKETTSASSMASVSTTSQSTAIQVLTDGTIGATGNPVDTSTFAYHLGICLFGTTSNLRFYSAEIFYTQ